MQDSHNQSDFSDLFYPGTQTLINLYNERDPKKLALLERDITAAVEISTRLVGPIKGDFDVPHTQAIHRELFGQIYPWAGELRTYPLFKKRPDGMTTEFARPDEFRALAASLKSAVAQIRAVDTIAATGFPKQMANVYQILNEMHAFREGNGRTHRLYLAHLASEAGYRLNYDKVEPSAWNHAASMSAQINIGGGERIPGRTDELVKVFEHIASPAQLEKNNAYTQGRSGLKGVHERQVLTLKELTPSSISYGPRNRIR
jgi:cell filamentation protein